MRSCENCQKSGCGGCPAGRELELTPQEAEVLARLGQIPFLPVARKAGDEDPVYLEDDAFSPAEYSLILRLLDRKGLISLDYDRPLARFDYAAYGDYPVHGSMALTARGQTVLSILETQGYH